MNQQRNNVKILQFKRQEQSARKTIDERSKRQRKYASDTKI